MKRIPASLAVPGLVLAALGAAGLSLVVGSTPLSQLSATILWEVRQGRTVLAFLVGASLAASGTAFQGLFRNPLADPFVAGVSGGAALGAVGAVVWGAPLWSAAAWAFAGGVGAALLAWRLARVRGRVPAGSLLLSGFAVGTFASAIVSVLLLAKSRNWNEVVGWLMGFVSDANPWDRVLVLAPCLAASVAVMAWHARDLDLLLLGEETAGSLGVDVEGAKGRLLVAASVAASAAVAVCGIVGFVGLIVPHAMRALVGPRHRGLLPAALVGGGVLLVLADIVARAAVPGVPMPVGAVTALCGAPFFLHLLRRKSLRSG